MYTLPSHSLGTASDAVYGRICGMDRVSPALITLAADKLVMDMSCGTRTTQLTVGRYMTNDYERRGVEGHAPNGLGTRDSDTQP